MQRSKSSPTGPIHRRSSAFSEYADKIMSSFRLRLNSIIPELQIKECESPTTPLPFSPISDCDSFENLYTGDKLVPPQRYRNNSVSSYYSSPSSSSSYLLSSSNSSSSALSPVACISSPASIKSFVNFDAYTESPIISIVVAVMDHDVSKSDGQNNLNDMPMTEESLLQFKKGQRIAVCEVLTGGWFIGYLIDRNPFAQIELGLFPSSTVIICREWLHSKWIQYRTSAVNSVLRDLLS